MSQALCDSPDVPERKPVLVKSSADKTVSEAAVALQASVQAKPWGKAIYTCPIHKGSQHL
jgi:hypothetical protein